MGNQDRGKRLIAVFLLGVALLNFPLLAVVEAGQRLLGLPPLFLYLFGIWGGLILLLALLVERRTAR
jgi:hypothetical protein